MAFFLSHVNLTPVPTISYSNHRGRMKMIAHNKTENDCANPELRNKRKQCGMFPLTIFSSRHLFTATVAVMYTDAAMKVYQAGQRTITRMGNVFHVSGYGSRCYNINQWHMCLFFLVHFHYLSILCHG